MDKEITIINFENLDYVRLLSDHINVKVLIPTKVGKNNLEDVSGVYIDINLSGAGLMIKDIPRLHLNDIVSIEHKGEAIYVPWGKDDWTTNSFSKTIITSNRIQIKIDSDVNT